MEDSDLPVKMIALMIVAETLTRHLPETRWENSVHRRGTAGSCLIIRAGVANAGTIVDHDGGIRERAGAVTFTSPGRRVHPRRTPVTARR